MIAWDSTGNVLSDGELVQGDGEFYVLARQEDDAFGFVKDVLEDLFGELLDEALAEMEARIAEIDIRLAEIEAELLEDDVIDDLTDEERADLENEKVVLEDEKFALEEILREIRLFGDFNLARVDAQTGAARIRSYAEVGSFDETLRPNVYHRLIPYPGVASQKIDHMFPDFFSDPDGHILDSIRTWLDEVAGVPVPDEISDAASVCGDPDADDGWKFVDLVCFEAGTFHVSILPNQVNASSENTGRTIALECPGQVDTAKIASSHSLLETQPVGSNSSSAVISVTAYDQFGNNIDGGEVTFVANTCKFTNPLAGAAGDKGHQPAGGGSELTMWTDSDSQADANFLANNPLQDPEAGTAEAMLECAEGTAGPVNVRAIVQRPGSDIVLDLQIVLVGPTAANGLVLMLTPAELECGETLIAEAAAVDANGQPVSDGTRIYFTTDTSSGIINGKEGGQGSNTTIGGKTKATVAISPDDPGVHTVIAYVLDKNGALLAQVPVQFECTKAVAAAPVVVPPSTGTGSITPPNTGRSFITPPSTGDAGLAAGDADHGVLAWIVASTVVLSILVLGILAGGKASYVAINGRRR
jgi:hypothetical protein